MAVVFKDRLLDPVLLTNRNRLPDPIISFDDLRNINALAVYTLVRNPQGLLYETTLGVTHLQQLHKVAESNNHERLNE
jgi:hypothetical protein